LPNVLFLALIKDESLPMVFFTLGKELSFSHFQPQNILNQVKFEMQLIQIMEYNK